MKRTRIMSNRMVLSALETNNTVSDDDGNQEHNDDKNIIVYYQFQMANTLY